MGRYNYSEVKRYLAMGGGVNSVAMLLLLRDRGERIDEVYFVDAGLDKPETYDYIETINREIVPITRIEGRNKEGLSLLEYCQKYRIMPHPRFMWCAIKFKLEPVKRYLEMPCVEYVGYDAGEKHRRGLKKKTYGIKAVFPLIEEGLDRAGCIAVIKRHGLPVPEHSNCVICPGQPFSSWERLSKEHPDLFQIAVDLEVQQNQRLQELGKPLFFTTPRPLSCIRGDWQLALNESGRYEIRYKDD